MTGTLTDAEVLAAVTAAGSTKEQIAEALGLDTALWNITLSGPGQMELTVALGRLVREDRLCMEPADGVWLYRPVTDPNYRGVR